MIQQIIKRCDAICYNEDEMHLGSYRTFKMIKDESIQLSQQIQHLEQQLATARRQGWEQAKREAAKMCNTHRSDYGAGGEYIADGIGRIIAAMEYKEKVND